MGFLKDDHISPQRIITAGFLLLILTGTILLMLPISTINGQGTPFIDALFTAASATCVTGLVVVNTANYFSFFGELVIIILIQIGGMGVVTLAIMVAMSFRKRINFKSRWIMQESIAAPHLAGIVRITGFIVKTTLIIEAIGALILIISYLPSLGFSSIWTGIFTSISAFCNAGFDIFKEGSSLTNYVGNGIVNFVVMALIVIGGIGFMTWYDFSQYKFNLKKYRLQSKIILMTTAILIILPTLYFFFYEFQQPQWANLSLWERIWASLFAAVTPRTAGFNTVDLTKLTDTSQGLTIILMLIGGAPGSTAGGFKVTTIALIYLAIRSAFHHCENIPAFDRQIPNTTLRPAVVILSLYLGAFLIGGTLISIIDSVPLWPCLFETASALGTVGLSLGITSGLSWISKLILIMLMYFGRVGMLTLIYALPASKDMQLSHYPTEDVTVG